jgi:hypothetical protein
MGCTGHEMTGQGLNRPWGGRAMDRPGHGLEGPRGWQGHGSAASGQGRAWGSLHMLWTCHVLARQLAGRAMASPGDGLVGPWIGRTMDLLGQDRAEPWAGPPSAGRTIPWEGHWLAGP